MSAQPSFLPHGKPLKVLTSGQQFLSKSPQSERILTPCSDMCSHSLKDVILDPLKNLVYIWADTQSTEISRPMFAVSSVIISVFFHPPMERSFVLWCQRIFLTRDVHVLHGDPMALGQVPSKLHPATRDDPSSILASKPRRTASPFQCDVLANNNQLVFWRNHQKRGFFVWL